MKDIKLEAGKFYRAPDGRKMRCIATLGHPDGVRVGAFCFCEEEDQQLVAETQKEIDEEPKEILSRMKLSS